MRNRTLQILAAIVVSVLPASAFAQGSGSDTMPELRLRGMPAALTACMRQCVAGHTPDTSCRPKTSSSAMRSLRAIKGRLASMQRQLRDHKHRIAALEAEMEANTGSMVVLRSQLDGQKRELAALSREVKQLYRFYHFVVEDYVGLDIKVGVDGKKITALQHEVSDLSSRVTALESRPGTVGIGVRIGGLVLSAPGTGTTFSSFLVGPRFVLRLSRDQAVSVDAQALVAAGDHPFGVRSRLGYQWRFSPHFLLDTGLSGTWAGEDSSLHAASAFIGPDAGLTWKPTKWLNVGGNLFMGAALTSGSSTFAVGGIGTVGLDLPF